MLLSASLLLNVTICRCFAGAGVYHFVASQSDEYCAYLRDKQIK